MRIVYIETEREHNAIQNCNVCMAVIYEIRYTYSQHLTLFGHFEGKSNWIDIYTARHGYFGTDSLMVFFYYDFFL